MSLKIARRAVVKLLGLLGFILVLVGGVLIVVSSLSRGGFSASSLAIRLFELLLGVGAIFGGLMIFNGPMRFGGMIATLTGVLLIAITGFATNSALVFVGGILGLVGSAMKPPWWMFWKK